MTTPAPYTYPEISPECLASLLARMSPDARDVWASDAFQFSDTLRRRILRDLALPKVIPASYGSTPSSIIDPGPLQLNIMAVPCLSMRHITPEDLARLYSDEEAANPGGIMGHLNLGSGCLLHLGDDDAPDFDLEWTGYSPAFRDLVRFVHSRGYHYLRLDADAPALPGLPIFTA